MHAIHEILKALGRAVERLRRLFAPLVDLRITILLLMLGGFAIFGLDQGRDVVRGLVDGANTYIGDGSLGDGAHSIILQWVAFWAACVWTGINAWYWSGFLYRSDPRRWFRWLRRFLGVLPLVSAILAMWYASDYGYSDIRLGATLFAVTVGLMLAGFVYSRRVVVRRAANRAQESGPVPQWHDIGFIAVSWLVAIGMLIVLIVPGLRTEAAWSLGAAALAFGAIGCILPVTSLIIIITRTYRLPAITIGLVAAAVFSAFNDNHEVRVLEGSLRERPTLDAALNAWIELHPDKEDPIVLVAAAGGASRAAYWTGSVLRALEDNDEARDFPRDIFAISGVSGGSLGAVGYAAWIADHQSEARRQSVAPSEERRAFVQDFFGADYLSPAVAGLLFPDLVQRFLPADVMPSRATSLEESWEFGWDRAIDACRARRDDGGRPYLCARRGRMSDDFLRIWDGVFDRKAGRPRRWVPIVLVNGTHVQTGKRIITAPVKIEPLVFEDAYDFFDLVKRPIRASTAVHNSARFPLVSPAGTLRGDDVRGHIVDGGYFENGGIETLVDIVRHIRAREIDRRIFIIEIINDDQMDDGDAERHDPTGEVLASQPVRRPERHDGSPFLGEVTSIVGGLYQTRDARGVLGAKRLSAADGRMDPIEFFQFRLGQLAPNRHTAMSWSISQSARDRMDVVFNVPRERVPLLIAHRNYTAARELAVIEMLCGVLDQGPTIANRQTLGTLMGQLPRTPESRERDISLALSQSDRVIERSRPVPDCPAPPQPERAELRPTSG